MHDDILNEIHILNIFQGYIILFYFEQTTVVLI